LRRKQLFSQHLASCGNFAVLLNFIAKRQRRFSKALNLYINDEQVQLAVLSDLLNPDSEISQKLSSRDIYPLFAIHEYFDDTDQFWQKDAVIRARSHQKQPLKVHARRSAHGDD